MKTGDKGETGKAVQILGCVVVTPRAKVPVSASGYDATNKGCPPIQPWTPDQQIMSFPGQSNLLNPNLAIHLLNLNLSPYSPVFMELLQGLGFGGTLGPQSMRATGSACPLSLPSLTVPPVSGRRGLVWTNQLAHLPGHRGFLHAPVALFSGCYYMVLKLLLRQFSTVFSKPVLACL